MCHTLMCSARVRHGKHTWSCTTHTAAHTHIRTHFSLLKTKTEHSSSPTHLIPLLSCPASQVVLHHLMKTGRTDSARLFAAAAKLPLDPSQFAELAELRAVLAALDAGDLAPPIAYAR